MFPPVKRVAFRDSLVELIPTPVIQESDDSDSDSSTSSEKRRREDDDDDRKDDSDEGGDVPETPVHGRRKRRREWVWTLGPMERDEGIGTMPEQDLLNGKCSDDETDVPSTGVRSSGISTSSHSLLQGQIRPSKLELAKVDDL